MNIEDYLKENPIMRFSVYSDLQIKTIVEVGDSIVEQFDWMIQKPNRIDMSKGDPYGKIWLWIIGTYEIVRTMSDPKWKDSWSESAYSRISAFKRKISELRIPFAKQEIRRKPIPVEREPSIHGFDFEGKSYLFEVNGTCYNIRNLIKEFEALIRSIKPDDVLCDLRQNQQLTRRADQ
jgi:hypothetical protein